MTNKVRSCHIYSFLVETPDAPEPLHSIKKKKPQLGEIAILHGRIIMNDKESGNEFFENYIDMNHPILPKESFNLSLLNTEHYRYNPILTFGRTYKYLTGGNEWKQLILKFEHILMNLNFDNAKMYLETEFLGNYEFFWKAQKIEGVKSLSFGAGKHTMFGRKIETAEPEMPMNTEYPITINEEVLKKFNSQIENLNNNPVNTKVTITKPYEKELWGHDATRVILTKLQLIKSIEWGYEKIDGENVMYIIRKENLKQINNAM